ncbi:S1 RNA-binding domain-containing protein [Candidatus Parcubacteria bacterium]|nr:S1 RNA-binding domain-containing protein [Candidatus Parcubacteria bacterium]
MKNKKVLDTKDDLINMPKVGEVVEGRVVGKARSALFLDLGIMGNGIIYGREYYIAKDDLKNLEIGAQVSAKIIEPENEDGYRELSLKEASQELVWEELRRKKEKEEIFEVKISGANKGGLLAQVSGVSAFLPVSQLCSEHYPRVEKGDQQKILIELQKFIGKALKVKILDLSLKENKLILSEKAKEINKIKEILQDYKVGDMVEGKVTGIVDFGVFIKFGKGEGELEGLCHLSELDWQLIEDPSKIVESGQEVKAKIIEIKDNKVSLSLKALKENPWDGIEKKFKKNDILKGEVTKFNPFGAFIQVAPKIQGLIHISEFGSQKKMAEVLEIGKEYKFQLLSLDPAKHSMILSLKK